MAAEQTPVEFAERVAILASSLGIDTVLIGAYALAAYDFVRGSSDIDLATNVAMPDLRALQVALEREGYQTRLVTPDEQDPLGGVLQVWVHVDDEGDPIEPVEIINYRNPYTHDQTPAPEAIRHGISLGEKPALRYPRLCDLIALKLFAGSRRDEADVVELLVKNPDADLEAIRTSCARYGLTKIEELIAEAEIEARRRSSAQRRDR